jgi:hypothetical protein
MKPGSTFYTPKLITDPSSLTDKQAEAAWARERAWCKWLANECFELAEEYSIATGSYFEDDSVEEIRKMARELYVAAIKETWRRAPGDDK